MVHGGSGSPAELGVADRSELTIDDVLIISCDRYGPWNGTYTGRPDHIWADVPLVTGASMLVYCEGEPALSADAYAFGTVDFLAAHLSASDRLRVIRDAGRDLLKALIVDRRLALGLTPLFVVRFLWRMTRGRRLSPYLCRFQVARLLIARELERRKPVVALFHGEFGPWGLAVTEACRLAGVIPIGVQHGPMSRHSPIYQSLDRLGHRIADGLLCVSDSETDKWRHLPLQVETLGSRRMRWSARVEASGGIESAAVSGLSAEQRPLVFPPSADNETFRTAVAQHPEISVCVKPHPLHIDGWHLPNVQVVDGEIRDLAGQFGIIITGSPGVQLNLSLLGVPYVRVRSSDTDDWPEMPGAVIFESLSDALIAVAKSDCPASLKAHHVPADMIPPDVTADGLLRVLAESIP